MTSNKFAKLVFAMAVFGLGLFTSCSESDGGVASSYSETQTGKPVIRPGMPIAELDTSYIHKVVHKGENPCYVVLPKSAVDEESDGVSEDDSLEVVEIVEVMDSIPYYRVACGAHDDIYMYIKIKAQIVDSEGLPVEGAIVYGIDLQEGSMDELMANPMFHAAYFDITDQKAIREFFIRLQKEYGRLDILVNNAGIMKDAYLPMITDEVMEKTFAVNVFAIIHLMKYIE